MEIALTPEHRQWLEDAVSAGLFASVEDAVKFAVAGLIDAGEVDDLAWARPLVDDARASIAAGKGLAVASVKAVMTERLRKLGAV